MAIFIHLNRKGSVSFKNSKKRGDKKVYVEEFFVVFKLESPFIITMAVLVNDVNVNIIL